MTREEAINMLKSKMDGNTDTSYEWAETVRMAIKALEQESCEDAISRQAVLDIVDSYSESQSNVEDVTQDIISDIVVLPPVTPQPKTGHWIKSKDGYMRCDVCGSRGSAIKARFCHHCGTKMVESQKRSDKE